MNIAYVISAYKLPDLLVRLVRRLDASGTTFLIHVDAKSDDNIYRGMAEPLAHLPNVYFLPRHPCYWSDFGHVRATLKGLRALIASGRPFDYVVLLTGQDYPLVSNAEIAATFEAAGGQIFIDWMPIPNDLWTNGGTYRIENWHFRVGRRPLSFPGAPFRLPWLNALWSLPARLFHLRRSFPPDFRPFGGSSYWMMPADCARYVDDVVRANPDFVKFFKYVRVPDEIFFQTVVLNSPFRNRIAEGDLRYVHWEGDVDHPSVLTAADFDTLMQSHKLFARKFDPGVDATVLDRIDQALHAGA